jgi:hypothetical protein
MPDLQVLKTHIRFFSPVLSARNSPTGLLPVILQNPDFFSGIAARGYEDRIGRQDQLKHAFVEFYRVPKIITDHS